MSDTYTQFKNEILEPRISDSKYIRVSLDEAKEYQDWLIEAEKQFPLKYKNKILKIC